MNKEIEKLLQTPHKKVWSRVRFTVELDRDVHEQFKKLCLDHGKKMGPFIEELVLMVLGKMDVKPKGYTPRKKEGRPPK